MYHRHERPGTAGNSIYVNCFYELTVHHVPIFQHSSECLYFLTLFIYIPTCSQRYHIPHGFPLGRDAELPLVLRIPVAVCTGTFVGPGCFAFSAALLGLQPGMASSSLPLFWVTPKCLFENISILMSIFLSLLLNNIFQVKKLCGRF